MSTPYERKTSFRAKLLETFCNGDPEGLDALLESPNPFGHFNFRCYHNATLTEAIVEAAVHARCNKLVILNMYKKLVERGLDSNDSHHMLTYFVHAPISAELMGILVPSEEHIAKTVEDIFNVRNEVHRRYPSIKHHKEGRRIPQEPFSPDDVALLNTVKENMNVFKNLPIVQGYLYTAETVQLAVNPADIRRHKQELHAARSRHKEKQRLCGLIDEVLNT